MIDVMYNCVLYMIHTVYIIYYAIISTQQTPLKIFQSPFCVQKMFRLPGRKKLSHKVGPEPIRYQWSYGPL